MAEETDKKPDLNDSGNSAGSDPAPIVAKVGDGGNPASVHRLLKLPKTSRRVKFLTGIIVAIIIIGGGWYVAKNVFHIGEKVYAQAAGHKIYKKEIDDLIGKTKGVSAHDAAKVLADKYLYEAMAGKAGITVSDQDIKDQYPDAEKSDRYARQGDINTVYYDKLSAYNAGLYKGQVLVANFSRNIKFKSPYSGIQAATNPLLGNKKAIAKDKKYAHDFITKLYKEVKSNKITFDEAIQMEHKDPQVGDKAYQTLPHSGSFDTSNVYLPGTSLISPKSIQPRLSKMKAGELSEPFPVRVENAWKDPKITTESYYLVVRMDYTKGSHSGLTFKKYLSNAKKQYGYKVNV